MLILSTVEKNKVTLKVGGSVSLDGLSASFDFKNFQKSVELENGKGTFDVTAEEAASLETPRVFARLEINRDGETIRTEFVDTIRVSRSVPARDRVVVSTVVIVNAPLDDAEADALNAENGQDGEDGQGQGEAPQGNLDNGAGEITDADAGQSDAPADDSADGETGQNGESEGQNGDNTANG